MTDENAAIALRGLGAARVEGPHDLELPQRRTFSCLPRVGWASTDVRLQKRLAEALRHGAGFHEKGRANLVHAGLERHANHPVVVELSPRQCGLIWDDIAVGVYLPLADAASGRPGGPEHLTLDVQRFVRRGRQREHVHALAVDADFEILLADEMRNVVIDTPAYARLDVELTVSGREVVDARAASRAHRHAFKANVLIKLVGHSIQLAVGRSRSSNREARHFLCGVEIALRQKRGKLQDSRDVVKAIADLVGRQQGAAVDVERQKVADRVLVLGSIQPMERLGASRIGIPERRDRRPRRMTRNCR